MSKDKSSEESFSTETKADQDDLESAAKQLTMSQETLLKMQSRNVRLWKPFDTLLWIEEIFSNVEDLDKFKNNFRSLGVTGVDLLVLNTLPDEEIKKSFGITQMLHLKRLRAHVTRLIAYQEYLDNEYAKNREIKIKERNYLDILKEYEVLTQRIPIYEVPDDIKRWKPVDLFFYLNKNEYEGKFIDFCKPLALLKVDGEKFKDMLQNDLNKQYSFIKDSDLSKLTGFPGLKGLITLDDVKRLDCALNEHENFIKFKNLKQEEKRKRDRAKYLPEINESEIKQEKKFIGSGSFGQCTLGIYKKKQVVIKSSITNGDESNEDKKNRCEDMIIEAYLLSRCASPGVIKFYGLYNDASKPHDKPFVTEYMSSRSIGDEINLAVEKRSEDSIFHPKNPRNIFESEKGATDPILLQIIRIGKDVASALAHIHSLGIIHLDISARNIFLDARKNPKIGDFGLASVEQDMIDMYSYLEKEKEKYGDYDIEKINLYIKDKETDRKYRSLMKKRPIKWMPPWAIAEKNPRIDRHVDVYSFGCFLYEMAEFKCPFSELTIEEVIVRKSTGQGNPQISTKVNSTLALIMNLCWSNYESQPVMQTISRELTNLRQSLDIQSYSLDSLYSNLSQVKGAFVSSFKTMKLDISEYDSLGTNSSNTNNSYANFDDIHNIKNNSSGSFNTFKAPNIKIIGEDHVRIAIPNYVDVNDISALAQYEGVGIPKDKVFDALHCALQVRDHVFISVVTQCVVLESKQASIEVIEHCFQCLEKVANDQHGYIDSNNEWIDLIKVILPLLTKIITEEITLNLSREQQIKLLKSGLPALNALIKGLEEDINTFTEYASNQNMQPKETSSGSMLNVIHHFLCDSFDLLKKESTILLHAVEIVRTVCDLDGNAIEKFKSFGMINQILDSIQEHSSNNKTIVSCVSTLKCFSLETILLSGYYINNTQKHLVITSEELISQYGLQIFPRLFSILELSLNNPHTEDRRLLFETMLQVMFQICETCDDDLLLIEIFLFFVTKQHISMIYSILQEYPDDFRINEGGIGLLGHILSSGQQVTLPANILYLVKTNGFLQTIPKADEHLMSLIPIETTAIDRLEVILTEDPNFDILLKAMEKFKVTSDIAIGIKKLEKQELDIHHSIQSKGIIDTMTMNTMATRRGTTMNTKGSSTLGSFFSNIWEEIITDKNGDRISAASIQQSAVIVIGKACDLKKEIQTRLYQSPFNEYILSALKTFYNEIQLVRWGCHALFSTCRKSNLHQRKLHQLQVVQKYLIKAYELHNDNWTVIDGIICACIGLLEPESLQVESLNKAKEIGYEIAIVITEESSLSMLGIEGFTLFAGLTQTVINNCLDEFSFPLIGNYLKLLTCLTYWIPDILDKELTLSFTKFESREKYFKIRDIIKEGLNQFYNKNNDKLKKIVTRNLHSDNNNSPKKTDNKGNNINNTNNTLGEINLNIVEDQKFESVQELMKSYNFRDIVIKRLPFYLLNKHGKLHPQVLASGLALLTSSFRTSMKSKLGDEVPIGQEINFQHNSSLIEERELYLNQGIITFCLIPIKERYDHPIAVRYALWFLTLLISMNEDSLKSNSFTTKTLTSSIMADLAVDGVIEWVIEVLAYYEDYYTIQVLGMVFLILMKELFHNRSRSNGQLLKSIIVKVLNKPLNQYKTLDEEGHDCYFINKSIDIFGSLSLHADTLLRIIENLQIITSSTSPSTATTGRTISHPSSKKELMTNNLISTVNPMLDKVWDGKFRPFSLKMVGYEEYDNEITKKRDILYILEIKWDENTKITWRKAYKYSQFRQLKEKILEEFSALPSHFIDTVSMDSTKTSWIFKSRDPSLIQGRIEKLSKWFSDIKNIPASFFSEYLLQFWGVSENIHQLHNVRLLKPIDIMENCSVGSIFTDIIAGIFIVGSGNTSGILDIFSKKGAKGILSIFQIIHEEGIESKPSVTMSFDVAIVSVGWNIHQRCVFAGLATGEILQFHLSTNNQILTYVGEIGFHNSPQCSFIINPYNNIFLSVSNNKKLLLYDMNKGEVVCLNGNLCTRITCVACDFMYNYTFIGSDAGEVKIIDLNILPSPNIIDSWYVTLDVKKVNNPIKSPIKGIWFVDERRLLFVLHESNITIYKVGNRTTLLKPRLDFYKRFELNENVKPCCLITVHYGKYLIVGCENGAIVVFEMNELKPEKSSSSTETNKTQVTSTLDNLQGLNANSSKSSMAIGKNTNEISPIDDQTKIKTKELFSSNKESLAPWFEVVKSFTNPEMRDWLRGQGVISSDAKTRIQLIKLVVDKSGKTMEDAFQLIVPDPSKLSNFPIFAWKLSVPNKFTSPYLCSIAFIESQQVLLFGCSDGTIQIVSLNDFFEGYTGIEKQMILKEQELFKKNNISFEDVKSSKKLKSGKKHILSNLTQNNYEISTKSMDFQEVNASLESIDYYEKIDSASSPNSTKIYESGKLTPPAKPVRRSVMSNNT